MRSFQTELLSNFLPSTFVAKNDVGCSPYGQGNAALCFVALEKTSDKYENGYTPTLRWVGDAEAEVRMVGAICVRTKNPVSA